MVRKCPDQLAGDPDRDEEDGLDETLVPCDAERQGGEGDIRDDELYAFVNSICRDGRARLWVVLDCCHSGTGVRGATKVRKLAQTESRSQPIPWDRSSQEKLAAGCVVLSACRATEVEPEYQDEGGHFGLLTRFLVQLLLQRPTISNVSYKTLQEAIVAQYRGDPTLVQPPTPQLEGSREILDQVVLGAGEAMDRAPCWEVVPAGRDLGQAMLLAGQLHGITAGSLYELAASPDAFTRGTNDQGPAENRPQSDWIRIEKVQGITSMGRVFHWTDEQQTETVDVLLPRDFRRGVAMERYHEPGALGIRVRVVRATDAQQDSPSLTPGEAPDVVQRALQNAQRPEEMDWITWTDDEMPCDVLLRIDGSHAALFPATGLNEGGQTFSARGSATLASLRGGWGPIGSRQPDQAITELQGYLRRIARVRNLLRLAALQTARDSSDVAVALELLSVELDEAYRISQAAPWVETAGSRSMRLEDVYALRVANRDRTVRQTVLCHGLGDRSGYGDPSRASVSGGSGVGRRTASRRRRRPSHRRVSLFRARRSPLGGCFGHPRAQRLLHPGPSCPPTAQGNDIAQHRYASQSASGTHLLPKPRRPSLPPRQALRRHLVRGRAAVGCDAVM